MTTTILLVEDNPITRKLVRFTLEKEGFQVIEAIDAKSALESFKRHGDQTSPSDGTIALVLQDLCLPDMDGFELVTHLRALPGGSDVPILVFSGMLSQHDEAKVAAAGFDDLVSKPVEPSRLVQIVRAHLPSTDGAPAESFGGGRRLVLADDDSVQRKLVAFRLQKAGFEVTTAADGEEALALARKVRPDAVVSDVLMPGLDGFGLCMELRRDPILAAVPIVLATNSYIEPADRELAKRAGAHDLVLRTPELREVLTTLRASLSDKATPVVPAASSAGALDEEHMRRMMRQLERQVALNARVTQRCTLLSAEMSVVSGISAALAGHADIDAALRHTLAACFDAGGISLGALYLVADDEVGDEGGERAQRSEPEALRVISFGLSPSWSEDDLLGFFGERELLERAVRGPATLRLTTRSEPAGQRMLERAGGRSALLVPLLYQGEPLGALFMVSRNGELETDDRLLFAEAVAGQISQSLALAQAFRQRERSEKLANQQASLLRSMLESIGDGVVVADENGRFIHWNAAADQLLRTRSSGNDPGGRPTNIALFDADRLTRVEADQLPLTRAIRGEAVDGMEVYVRPEGAEEGVWLSVSARPWRDESGSARGGVTVFRDVTGERATKTHLMVSDRMASVGMLAAGVAHEINNPLACVVANLDLLHQALVEPSSLPSPSSSQDVVEMIGDAREAADRVRLIVRDLKIFSRHEDTSSGPVSIERVLESSLRMAWNEIRHRARLIKDFKHKGFVVGTDSRLGQVFLNLIVNAAQAIGEGNADDNEIRVSTGKAADGRVVVEVADSGQGISAENLPNLFTPFFTTKAAGVGTGLGLAICHRIITGLGGEIEVGSEVGKGTVFRVLLSEARPELVEEPARQRATKATVRRARILVIDDEPKVAAVIARTLARDHEVSSLLSAVEALEQIRGGEIFDVVFCDLMMPQMTGAEFFDEVKRVSGDLADRIIFLTGGAFTPAARAFLDAVPNQRVEKPFDPQHLRALVNDRVDRDS